MTSDGGEIKVYVESGRTLCYCIEYNVDILKQSIFNEEEERDMGLV